MPKTLDELRALLKGKTWEILGFTKTTPPTPTQGFFRIGRIRFKAVYGDFLKRPTLGVISQEKLIVLIPVHADDDARGPGRKPLLKSTQYIVPYDFENFTTEFYLRYLKNNKPLKLSDKIIQGDEP